jgi:hypothetical protein
VFRDLRVPGTSEVYRQILGGFDKVNPFAGYRGIITVDLGDGEGIKTMDEAALEKSLGQTDDEREFSCWVECRLPGTDQIVHRSADVKLKRSAAAGTAVAGSFT